MISSPSQNGTCSSSFSACAPKMPLIASQAIVDSHISRPGTTTVLPNGILASGSWATPVRGPQVHRYAAGSDPMMVPATIATTPRPKPTPTKLAVARVPMKNPATASFVGVGFGLGVVAIVAGTIIGSLPAAYLCTWGPRTGVAQLPLARIPFGRTVVVPGLLMWLSTIAWDAINGIFGAQALKLLLHVPFWLGLLIILALQGLIGVFGYEVLHTYQKWMAVVLGIMFAILTFKISSIGNFSAPATAHGASLVGGFILMVTLSISFVITWAPYASDYTRYMKPSASRPGIFWATLGGLTIATVWVEFLGLAAASLATDQTSGGVRVLRPLVAVIVTVVAFALTLWLNTGNLASKFTNLILFISYWDAPFAAIVMVDWWQRRGRLDVSRILRFEMLSSGWSGLVALAAGFGASVPFMNTTLFVGPVPAHLLFGGDIAYYVGFAVGGLVYAGLSRVEARRPAQDPLLTGAGR